MGEDRVRVDDPGLVRETGMTIMVSSTSLAMTIASHAANCPLTLPIAPSPPQSEGKGHCGVLYPHKIRKSSEPLCCAYVREA
jgi:hypothetical protein